MYLLKKSLKVLVLLSLGWLLISCSDDMDENLSEYDQTEIEKNSFFQVATARSSNGSGDDVDLYEDDCFALVYPVDISLPDGTVLMVSSDDELEMLIDDWLSANPDATEYPTFIFPIDIIIDSMENVTIQSEAELEELIASCEDLEEDDYEEEDEYEDDDEYEELEYESDCFEFVFPIDVLLPDNTTATANDEDELEDIIEDWYDVNTDSDEDPVLVYPIEILLDGNTTQTVQNMDELVALIDSCIEEEEGYEDEDDDEDEDDEEDEDEDEDDDEDDD